MQGLAQEVFAHLGTVGVGGVDEVDPEVDGVADDADGRVMVGRVAPDAGPRDAHGPEAEPVDRDGIVAAESELSGRVHGSLGHAAMMPLADFALCRHQASTCPRPTATTVGCPIDAAG